MSQTTISQLTSKSKKQPNKSVKLPRISDNFSHEQKKAWEILTEDEKIALTLQLGYEKSTWEAGEILGKAHYKYLEIKERAITFFKLFTQHFRIYDTVIPPQYEISPGFRLYIENVIQKRLPIAKSLRSIPNSKYHLNLLRNIELIRELKKLEKSESAHANNLLALLLEFDRWNNFRILPREYQQPHAFKRRNKNRYKKHLTVMFGFPKAIQKVIVRKYHDEFLEKPGFTVLFKPQVKVKKYKILKVSRDENIINQLSKLVFFVFHTEQEAIDFAEAILEYQYTPKTCQLGQKFWPKYRELLQQSINYKQVDNIFPNKQYIEAVIIDL